MKRIIMLSLLVLGFCQLSLAESESFVDSEIVELIMNELPNIDVNLSATTSHIYAFIPFSGWCMAYVGINPGSGIPHINTYAAGSCPNQNLLVQACRRLGKNYVSHTIAPSNYGSYYGTVNCQ